MMAPLKCGDDLLLRVPVVSLRFVYFSGDDVASALRPRRGASERRRAGGASSASRCVGVEGGVTSVLCRMSRSVWLPRVCRSARSGLLSPWCSSDDDDQKISSRTSSELSLSPPISMTRLRGRTVVSFPGPADRERRCDELLFSGDLRRLPRSLGPISLRTWKSSALVCRFNGGMR